MNNKTKTKYSKYTEGGTLKKYSMASCESVYKKATMAFWSGSPYVLPMIPYKKATAKINPKYPATNLFPKKENNSKAINTLDKDSLKILLVFWYPQKYRASTNMKSNKTTKRTTRIMFLLPP